MPVLLNAQPFRREIATIPVTMSGARISQPFAGGVNTPNHQFVDIDGDGDLDLFVFDDDFIVDFYRNVGTRTAPSFVLQPGAIQLPPFQTFFLFYDLNADGLIDLVTDNSSSGIRYYRNTGTRSHPVFTLSADPMLDADGQAMFAGFSSIPSFGDFNGDGLPDFISTNTADGSINYYENRGTASEPNFKFITGALQGITIIGDTCLTPIAGNRPQNIQHGSGAYFAADVDANGTTDILYGDFFSSGLFFLRNAGTPAVPFVECGSNHFPPNDPVATVGFNQPSLVDIDGDGDRDLFVGALNEMGRHSFWYYENVGSGGASQFELRTKDYLSVIDAGHDASPVLADIDHDGKLDLVVGNLNGQLWYFHNDGSITNPSFTLADTLFGGIGGNFSYAPAFADIDGDGLDDAIVGQFNGVVKFYRNIGTATVPRYDLDPTHVDSLTAGKFDAAPALVDIDDDGDLDLFVGKSDGTINFYRNDGNATAPLWNRVTEYFQNVYVVESAKPIFRDIDNDGDFDLLIGNADGDVLLYENFGTKQSPVYRCSLQHFVTTASMKNASPALGDLDGDGDLDVVIGTSKGGMQFYRNIHSGGPFVTHSVQLLLPVAGAASQTIPVNFRWTTAGCALAYALQVSRDAGFIQLVVNDTTLVDTVSIVSGLLNATQYFWRVQTRFEGGQLVASETRQFTTISAIPSTPALLLPANHTERHPLTVPLRWLASVGAERYHVQVSTDGGFRHLIADDSTLTDTSYRAGPLDLGTRYYWRVQAKNIAGRSVFSAAWDFMTVASVPYALQQNHPNPVRGETNIKFALPDDERVQLKIFNVLGENVATVLNETMSAGEHVAVWRVGDVPSGVYFYRLITRDFSSIKKFIVTK